MKLQHSDSVCVCVHVKRAYILAEKIQYVSPSVTGISVCILADYTCLCVASQPARLGVRSRARA